MCFVDAEYKTLYYARLRNDKRQNDAYKEGFK